MIRRKRLKRSLTLPLALVSSFLVLLYFLRSNDLTYSLPSDSLDQFDPALHDMIRKKFLIHPDAKQPYNLSNPHNSWFSQHYIIEPVLNILLKNKRKGVFFEAGAYDGETNSNSLYFEKDLSWTGILVEPSLKNVETLKSKHRKALIVPACLSSFSYSVKVSFSHRGQLSVITDDQSPTDKVFQPFYCMNGTTFILMNLEDKSHQSIVEELQCVPGAKDVQTQCFPLYSILQAAGYTTIDFMSLDVEGTEMAVLSTIPFDKVDIKVLLIETNKIKEPQLLVNFLRSHNYKLVKKVDQYDLTKMLPDDMLFIKD